MDLVNDYETDGAEGALARRTLAVATSESESPYRRFNRLLASFSVLPEAQPKVASLSSVV